MTDAARTGQADAAAERSAHVGRVAETAQIQPGGPLVENPPWTVRARVAVEAEAEIARLRAALAKIELSWADQQPIGASKAALVKHWLAECHRLRAIARAALAGEAAP